MKVGRNGGRWEEGIEGREETEGVGRRELKGGRNGGRVEEGIEGRGETEGEGRREWKGGRRRSVRGGGN